MTPASRSPAAVVATLTEAWPFYAVGVSLLAFAAVLGVLAARGYRRGAVVVPHVWTAVGFVAFCIAVAMLLWAVGTHQCDVGQYECPI